MYMKRYLIEITNNAGNKMEFNIEAFDEEDALERAKQYVNSKANFNDCQKDTIKVLKENPFTLKKDFADLVIDLLTVNKKK